MRHIQDIQSVQNIKTLRGEDRGSIPKERRSLFLDLYLHEKERERLEQEISLLEKKNYLNHAKLQKTIKNISRLKREINQLEIHSLGPKPSLFAVSQPAEPKKKIKLRKVVRRGK